MRHSIFLLTLVFSFSFYITAISQPTPLAPIILILDGSGSMWGAIDGKTKIEVAREVVGKLVDKMEVERPVGLVAYGHRRKGDCLDIETLVEASAGQQTQIKTVLGRINPVGKTPLASTALKVIEGLKTSGKSATIILVSDGAESCGGDLCAVVQAAKDAGVDFVLHIVGFDIGESDKLALECAARAGGGVYTDAKNGEQLSEALEQASELTVETTDASLRVKVSKDGQLHDATVQVYRASDEGYVTSLRTYTGEMTNPAMFNLASGSYHIRVVPVGTKVDEIWERDIIVPQGEVKEVAIDFTAGNISIGTTANGELWDCSVYITRAGSNKQLGGGRTYTSSSSNPLIQEFSPGFYDIKVNGLGISGENTSQTFENIEVKARETTELSHEFSYGELSIKSTNNGALWDCVINVFRAGDPNRRSVAGGRTYVSPRSNPMMERMTPGAYGIQFKASKIHGESWEHIVPEVEVRAGNKEEVHYNYKTGTLHIGTYFNGALCESQISIYQNGKSIYSKRMYASAKGNPRDIVLGPGTYEVQVDPRKVEGASKKSFTVSITTNQTIEKLVEF